MPAANLEEFRRWALSLVVDEGAPAARVLRDLRIAESELRRWALRHLVEAGSKPEATEDERDELARLCCQSRVLRMEPDLLTRAAAFFTTENVLPRK